MASSSKQVPNRGQYKEVEDAVMTECQAAMVLLHISVDDATHSPAPAATGVAAPKVSTKVADDVRSNEGIPCLPNKSLNIGESSMGLKNWLHAISTQHWKIEADSKSEKAKNDSKSEDVKTKSKGSFKTTMFKKPTVIQYCPRCNSRNTKFCYFNNYREDQPRHMCKTCKRTWTHGGILRDVPEGSRRRNRNKQPSNHPHATKPCDANGDVLGTPHCQSHAINKHVLPSSAEGNEAMSQSEVLFSLSRPPIHNTKEQKNSIDLVSLGSGDSKEEKSCLSSAVVSNSSKKSMPEKESSNILGYGTGMKEPPPHTQSNHAESALVFRLYTGSNSAAITTSTQFRSYGSVMENSVANLLSSLPPLMPRQGIHAPIVPFPQVSLFQNCIPSWPNEGRSAPWLGSSGTSLASLPPRSVAGSGSGSFILGKHPREANCQEEENVENILWVPKALKITDPDEAAKRTIWKALRIKPDERLFR